MYKVNVYDFDGTIYNGDSSIDFLIFSMKKKKKLIKYLPRIFIFLILKLFGIVSTKKFKEEYFKFIKDINNLEDFVNDFWKIKMVKTNKLVLKTFKMFQKNIVISASPEFLLKPFVKKFNNVELIATKFDKNGKILGENCKGQEKVKRLGKYKKINIENFYTDSIDDMPLISLAKNSFYVKKGKVKKWNTNELKKEKNRKKSICLFYFFLVFYLLIGVLLSYNYDFSSSLDLLFDFDSERVISDISYIFANHTRLTVHPLFVLIIQPFYFIINGFTQNYILAIIFILSLFSSLSVVFMYKLFSLFSENEKLKILICLCYGLTFSNIIFTAGIELYNIASFILILFWYFIAKKINSNWEKSDFIVLVMLGILLASITITNYIVFLIGCLILLISKKVKFKKLFFVNIIIIILIFLLSFYQNFIWQNTPTITSVFNITTDENRFIDFSFNFLKIKNVIRDCLYNSILPSSLHLGINGEGHNTIMFGQVGLYAKIIISMFLLFTCYFLKNFKNNFYLNLGIILSFIFNFVFHIIYGNNSCFLYSLHFIYLLFILFGINSINSSNDKYRFLPLIFLFILLISEILINGRIFVNIIQIISGFLDSNYYVKNFKFLHLIIITLFVIIILMIILNLITYFIKRIIFNKNNLHKAKNLIIVLLLFIFLETIFVALQTIPKYEKILWHKIEYKFNNISINDNYKIFMDKYPDEVYSYINYAKEYDEFISTYNATINYDIPNNNFYLFGMGNRKKILFKENKLIDIETENNIKEFNIKDYLIIPNEYTVLIKDKDGKFQKIYENEEGVFIETQNEKILVNGTGININLYTFEKQKYQNIKKVLYNEILFNIKDDKIIPNIFVYDSPWYRDAAMACMVLKQTNNTDLIKNWVDSITNIYDKQNNNEKEPDNLGELLYIISTQKNKNYKLINKIQKEAENIANDKNYLYGQTDFSNQFKYQNMWYELGIKSLGMEFKFNYNNLNDNYSNLAWWNNKNAMVINNSKDYPYLSWANFHANNKQSEVFVNNKLYPLSYEKNASQANYKKLNIINDEFSKNKISPTHVWTASEMLLFILDETHNLNNIY